MTRLSREIALIVCVAVMAPAAGICCSSDVTCAPGQMCVRGDCRPYEAPRVICGIAKLPSSTSIVLGLAESRASRIVQDIAEAVGLENVPTVYSGNVDNAVAFMRDDERIIVYNSDFIDMVADIGGTGWEARFILAHEFCHHVEGHIFSGTGCSPEQELQADACAARVLKRQGATLVQTTAAMRVMDDPASRCYPSAQARVARIAAAYGVQGGSDVAHRRDARPIEEHPKVSRPQGPFTFGFEDGSVAGYELAKSRATKLRPGMTAGECNAVMSGKPYDGNPGQSSKFIDGRLCWSFDYPSGLLPAWLFGYTHGESTQIAFALVFDTNAPSGEFVLERIEPDPPYRCGDLPEDQGVQRAGPLGTP